MTNLIIYKSAHIYLCSDKWVRLIADSIEKQQQQMNQFFRRQKGRMTLSIVPTQPI